MRLVILLLLAGCGGYQTLDDLYVEHSQCTLAERDCSELDEKIRKRERIVERRKERQGPDCGHLIALCDSWGRCTCISRSELWW